MGGRSCEPTEEQTIRVYVDTRQDNHSEISLCAFAQQDTKENSVMYSRSI